MTCWCSNLDCSIPLGVCHCGCGGVTPIGNRTRLKEGLLKGRPLKYLPGHHHADNARKRRTVASQPSNPFIRHIPLTQGQYAVVDTHLYDWLIQWNWNAWWNPTAQSYYASRIENVNGVKRTVRIHRVIVGLLPGDKRIVDHDNGDTLFNVGSNLRIGTSQGNNANSRSKHDGLKGTTRRSDHCFIAQIMVNRKGIYLGSFKTEMEAHEAYMAAARKHFGEYACDGKRQAPSREAA